MHIIPKSTLLVVALTSSVFVTRRVTATSSSIDNLHRLAEGMNHCSYRPVSTSTMSTQDTLKRSTESDVNSPSKSNSIRDIIHLESRGYDIHSPNNIQKRADYLSWDDYFLAVAYLSGQRSKDPHPSSDSSGGACIVDTMGRIVGIGYDGFPRGCSDDCLPWASPAASSTTVEDDTRGEEAWLNTKEPYLVHAEINAILNKCSADVVGGRMFVPNFPCEYLSTHIV